MIKIDFTKTSLTVDYLKRISSNILKFNKLIRPIYTGSFIYKASDLVNKNVRMSFKHSFIRKLAYDQKRYPGLINDSRLVGWITKGSEKFEHGTITSSKRSFIFKFSNKLISDFLNLPVKSLSLILSLAIVVNLLLSVALKKGTTVPMLVLQALFLLVAMVSFMCNIKFSDIIRKSITFKLFSRKH